MSKKDKTKAVLTVAMLSLVLVHRAVEILGLIREYKKGKDADT